MTRVSGMTRMNGMTMLTGVTGMTVLKRMSRRTGVTRKFDFKGDQKKGRIQPENFCVCAPENCPLQGGAESWPYWATI